MKSHTTKPGLRLRAPDINDDDDVFDSGIVLIKSHDLYIGTELLAYCDAIQQKFPRLEWSIMLKGKWIPEGYSVSKSFAIPDQEVAGAEVNLNDREVAALTAQGYNTIIHSHPFPSSSFSSSDMETLTSTAECSILYSEGAFTTATIGIRVATGLKLLIMPDIKMIHDIHMDLPDNITSKIKTRSFDHFHGCVSVTNRPRSVSDAVSRTKKNGETNLLLDEATTTTVHETFELYDNLLSEF